MAKSVGAVIFEDSTRLYLIFDGALDTAMRPLFRTEQAAQEWLNARMPHISEPTQAEASEEAVTILMDLELESLPGSAGRFASRASKQALWLTGPRSFLEMAYQNGATASRAF